MVQRYLSARIGEGIIFDLRTQVYDHVQRMPLQFFTRTQTGALVSRLNNDVIGAQQAFTSTLSGTVGNVIALVLTAAVMFSLSWQVTLLSLVLVPAFLLPARLVGRRMAEITRESYQLDAKMNATMTERFGVAGAMLVKLFGRPETEAAAVLVACGPGPRHRYHAGDVRHGVLRRDDDGGVVGHGADLRRGRLARGARHAPARHGGVPRVAADPAVRPDHGAVQCPSQRDECSGLVRAGIRGGRPDARPSQRSRTR